MGDKGFPKHPGSVKPLGPRVSGCRRPVLPHRQCKRPFPECAAPPHQLVRKCRRRNKRHEVPPVWSNSDGAKGRQSRRQIGDVTVGTEDGRLVIVMVMKRSHRVALKPTPEQESLFNQHAGYACFAYNWAVAEFKAGLDVGEWLTERTLRPRWNKVKGMIAPWGSELSQNAAKYAIMDLGQAAGGWGEYRRRVKAGQRPGRRVGFPRFKRRKHEQGFRADNGPDTVRVNGKVVILPKIGRVDMVEHLRFAGSIREVTIIGRRERGLPPSALRTAWSLRR